jgi:glycosyltransferase involved in cell wall biosynthesis
VSLGRRHTIDVIHSTSASVTSHLVAYSLKKVLGKPWVADFQDPWPYQYFPSGVQRMLARRIERSILEEADRITVTSDPFRALLQGKSASLTPHKFSLIPMGFDPVAFAGIQTVQRTKFTVTHFGHFYYNRSPAGFLEALVDFLAEDPSRAQEIEVLFLGGFDSDMLVATKTLLDQHGLKRVVRLEGTVPYETGVQLLMSSHVLLIIAHPGDQGTNYMTAKVFDYLAAGRTILALVPEAAVVTRVLREANAGVVVDPGNVKEIKEAISRLYRLWKDGRLHPTINPDVVRRFTWRERTRQLASTLEDALLQSGAPGAIAGQ